MSDIKEHHRKIMVEYAEYTIAWLENGGRIEVHAWRKLKVKLKNGKKGKKFVWVPRIFDVMLIAQPAELYWEERELREENEK